MPTAGKNLHRAAIGDGHEFPLRASDNAFIFADFHTQQPLARTKLQTLGPRRVNQAVLPTTRGHHARGRAKALAATRLRNGLPYRELVQPAVLQPHSARQGKRMHPSLVDRRLIVLGRQADPAQHHSLAVTGADELWSIELMTIIQLAEAAFNVESGSFQATNNVAALI